MWLVLERWKLREILILLFAIGDGDQGLDSEQSTPAEQKGVLVKTGIWLLTQALEKA